MRKGTILVTGGAGYIGSHTIVELIEAGFEVVSADNYSNSDPIAYENIKNVIGKDITHYNLNLCDRYAAGELFKKHPNISGIIHFAAFKSVPDSVARPLVHYHNNNASLINMVHFAKEYEIKNFIFSSSCSVYGNVGPADLPVTEKTPIKPSESPYASTKQMGEEILRHFANSTETVKSIALRYFNPVGAHISGKLGELPSKIYNNLVPLITQAAIGWRDQLTVFGEDWDTRDGSCVRDYIHVSDIANAHVKALIYLLENNSAPKFDIVNLGSGKGVSVLEAINSFEKSTSVKVPYKMGPRRDGDVESIYSKPEKAKTLLQWEPKYGIDEMMESAWRWQVYMKENGYSQS